MPQDTGRLTFRSHLDRFLEPVVPLCTFHPRKGRELHGTGLLVKHAGSLFLISARHTFDPLRKGETLYVYGPDEYPMTGQLRSSRGTLPVDGTGEEIDVGVMRLDPQPRIERTPLSINNLGGHVRPVGGEELVICGYPRSKTKVRKKHLQIRSVAYVHTGLAVNKDKYSKLDMNPRFRIAMGFHTRKVRALDGKRQRAPHPECMSGSPMWIVNQTDDGLFRIGVIGIMTDYVAEHKVLIGTTIAAAVGVIQGFDKPEG